MKNQITTVNPVVYQIVDDFEYTSRFEVELVSDKSNNQGEILVNDKEDGSE